MHSLQSYRAEEPRDNGEPHTFSYIYHDGTLKKYGYHMTAPTTAGGQHEYHMNQIDTWGMAGKLSTFVEGATDLRNTLDLTKTYRTALIENANAGASQAAIVTGRQYSTTEMPSTKDSADKLAPTPPYSVTQAKHQEESLDELAASPLRYLYKGDDSQDPSGKSCDFLQNVVIITLKTSRSYPIMMSTIDRERAVVMKPDMVA